MALEEGTHPGHYEIVSSLGAGGMGEVYRAKDTKPGREVAIKLLLEGVSQDPERLARFEREAKVLASLNHNNIATLYGFEQEGETNFLVMELVEGERGPKALRSSSDKQGSRVVIAAGHRWGRAALAGAARLRQDHRTLLLTRASSVTRSRLTGKSRLI